MCVCTACAYLHHVPSLSDVAAGLEVYRKSGLCVFVCVCACVDAAGVHEEGNVLFPGDPLCPGPVPHPLHEDHHYLPQCCLVGTNRNRIERSLI